MYLELIYLKKLKFKNKNYKRSCSSYMFITLLFYNFEIKNR